jgi:hypothetical protein
MPASALVPSRRWPSGMPEVLAPAPVRARRRPPAETATASSCGRARVAAVQKRRSARHRGHWQRGSSAGGSWCRRPCTRRGWRGQPIARGAAHAKRTSTGGHGVGQARGTWSDSGSAPRPEQDASRLCRLRSGLSRMRRCGIGAPGPHQSRQMSALGGAAPDRADPTCPASRSIGWLKHSGTCLQCGGCDQRIWRPVQLAVPRVARLHASLFGTLRVIAGCHPPCPPSFALPAAPSGQPASRKDNLFVSWTTELSDQAAAPAQDGPMSRTRRLRRPRHLRSRPRRGGAARRSAKEHRRAGRAGGNLGSDCLGHIRVLPVGTSLIASSNGEASVSACQSRIAATARPDALDSGSAWRRSACPAKASVIDNIRTRVAWACSCASWPDRPSLRGHAARNDACAVR